MNTDVRTVDATTPIAELVPVFANYGHHHIPVLDANQRLAGMITQADLIAGLYRQTLTSSSDTRHSSQPSFARHRRHRHIISSS